MFFRNKKSNRFKGAELADDLFSAPKKRGFSLVEMVIAVSIFSLVIIAVMSAYVSIFKVNRSSKNIQINVENAQTGMNLMAKSIRMSSIVDCLPNADCSGAVTSLRAYDFSQLKCVEYSLDAGSHSLVYAEKSVADPENWIAECTPGAALGSEAHIIDAIVDAGAFSVTKTSDTEAGMVTVMLTICSSENCAGANNQETRVQTTISLLNMQETSP